jgi:hypothetical protein
MSTTPTLIRSEALEATLQRIEALVRSIRENTDAHPDSHAYFDMAEIYGLAARFCDDQNVRCRYPEQAAAIEAAHHLLCKAIKDARP